jgi:hypothetical protein
MAADWYIDVSISGGNGTDPSSAFPSVLSVTWGEGDRGWLRRTHAEVFADGNVLGPATAEADGFSKWNNVIGWPEANQPWYQERPSAGRTPWDGDAPAGLFGFKFPIISNSGNAASVGIHLGKQCGIFNVTFVSCGGANGQPFDNAGATVHQCYVENVAVLGPNGYFSTIDRILPFQMGKITWAFSSNAGTGGLFFMEFSARHLVIHSLSHSTNGLFRIDGTQYVDVGLLEIHTQSLAALFAVNLDVNEEGDSHVPFKHINRVTGQRPYRGVTSGAYEPAVTARIDDYYGEGPGIRGSDGNPTTRVASNMEAQHDDRPVMIYRVLSMAAAQQRYWDSRNKFPSLRKPFDVVSGTGIEIRVPIYVDSTAIFSPAVGALRGYLQCAGSRPAICTSLIVGTPAEWVGSMCVAGSAWLWSATFTPNETASNVMFDVHMPPYTQSGSGVGLTAYALFGEPYKV